MPLDPPAGKWACMGESSKLSGQYSGGIEVRQWLVHGSFSCHAAQPIDGNSTTHGCLSCSGRSGYIMAGDTSSHPASKASSGPSRVVVGAGWTVGLAA